MLAPRARGDVDPARLRDSLPYPLLPFVLQQLPSDSPTVLGRALLRRWPILRSPTVPPVLRHPVVQLRGDHRVGSLALARKRAAEAELELRGRGRVPLTPCPSYI